MTYTIYTYASMFNGIHYKFAHAFALSASLAVTSRHYDSSNGAAPHKCSHINPSFQFELDALLSAHNCMFYIYASSTARAWITCECIYYRCSAAIFCLFAVLLVFLSAQFFSSLSSSILSMRVALSCVVVTPDDLFTSMNWVAQPRFFFLLLLLLSFCCCCALVHHVCFMSAVSLANTHCGSGWWMATSGRDHHDLQYMFVCVWRHFELHFANADRLVSRAPVAVCQPVVCTLKIRSAPVQCPYSERHSGRRSLAGRFSNQLKIILSSSLVAVRQWPMSNRQWAWIAIFASRKSSCQPLQYEKQNMCFVCTTPHTHTTAPLLRRLLLRLLLQRRGICDWILCPSPTINLWTLLTFV